jgi:RNA polymerase sigma-70 factor (ECF subfamily)
MMENTQEPIALPCEDQDFALRLVPPAAQPHNHSELESVVIRLFDQCQARLLSYVLTFGLSLYDAEDIVQETFLALFRHLQLGRPRTNLDGWLFRVAHNLALKRRTAIQVTGRNLIDESVLAQQPCPSLNAEEEFLLSQKQQRLRAIFQALPEQDKRCLHLRAEGLKYRQIADVLGISLGAVSLSLARSLARIMRATGSE